MFPSKRFINSIIPIMTIKHHKKKKNAMSGSEEQANAVSFQTYQLNELNQVAALKNHASNNHPIILRLP